MRILPSSFRQAISLVFCIFCLAVPVKAQVNIYIAIRTDSIPGAGTEDDPYDGSIGKLDEILNTIPKVAKIHLGPGTFLTNGQGASATFRGMPAGATWTLTGCGEGITILKLANNRLTATAPTQVLFANFDFNQLAERIEVSHMTFDCNRANQSGYPTGAQALDAIALYTKLGYVHDVEVKGVWANPGEGFPIRLYTSGGTRADRDLRIERVRCMDAEGNMTIISCFDQTGGSFTGYIKDCVVRANHGCVGFGSGGWDAFEVSGNTATGCDAGIVIDTHKYRNVRILNNHFEASRYAILANGGGPYDEFIIANNNITSSTQECLYFNAVTNLLCYGNILTSGGRLPIFNIANMRKMTGRVFGNHYMGETLGLNRPPSGFIVEDRIRR